MLKFFFITSLLLTQLSYASAEKQQSLIRLLSKSEIKSLLGDFPKKGSSEEMRDYAVLLKYQVTRTKADCQIAEGYADLKLEALFTSNNGPLSKSEAHKISLTLLKRMGETGMNILRAKDLYDRPRPYKANPLIKPCIERESTTAYPSGHATYSRVIAMALSKIYPERAEAFLKRANEIAESRVLGGVHHPSDIEAGKKLADAIAMEFINSEAFLDLITEIQ